MLRLRPVLAAAALIVLAHPAAAQGRNPLDLLHEAQARGLKRTEGVQNYTVHTKMMGNNLISYVSRTPDGSFQVQMGGGTPIAASLAEMAGWGDGLLLILESGMTEGIDQPGAEEAFTYGGVVNNGGAAAHRISANLPADGPDDVPLRFVVDFDTATLLTRRMHAEMAISAGTPGSLLVELGDWRPAGTMLLPFRRHMVIRGMRAEIMGADTADAERMLAQGQAVLASLPKEQRESMRQLLEVMKSLYERDEIVLDQVVTSVTVNQGPPPGISLGPPRGN